jgi:hypothetical protein
MKSKKKPSPRPKKTAKPPRELSASGNPNAWLAKVRQKIATGTVAS